MRSRDWVSGQASQRPGPVSVHCPPCPSRITFADPFDGAVPWGLGPGQYQATITTGSLESHALPNIPYAACNLQGTEVSFVYLLGTKNP